MRFAGNPSVSRFGLHSRRCKFGDPSACFTCKTHLTKPAAPAPPSRCPKFDLDVVTIIVWASSPCVLYIRLKDPNSIGSPKAVPVPWHSKQSISIGRRPASLNAPLRHFSWDGPFGAVMLALRPSWFVWLPPGAQRRRRHEALAPQSVCRTFPRHGDSRPRIRRT